MGISYEPLMHLLIKKGLKKTDLLNMTNITTNTLAKFSRGEQVGLDVIEKLCKALDCQPSDIFEFVPGLPGK
ncbi:MAG: helix-turn-helix transcriptional regulator [Treponema sp.]|jgi:DNA-binding Xre family transcriptional regulator|nr:helix-turn-helix transcriptional regulator [Treponema sp.]